MGVTSPVKVTVSVLSEPSLASNCPPRTGVMLAIPTNPGPQHFSARHRIIWNNMALLKIFEAGCGLITCQGCDGVAADVSMIAIGTHGSSGAAGQSSENAL